MVDKAVLTALRGNFIVRRLADRFFFFFLPDDDNGEIEQVPRIA